MYSDGLTKIVLVSTVPGLDSKQIGEKLRLAAKKHGRVLEHLNVERDLKRIAKEEYGDLLPRLKNSPVLAYALPISVIHECAQKAMCATFEEARKRAKAGADVVLVFFHPIFLHQRQRAFMQPYDPQNIAALMKDDLDLWTVASIHDDVYDNYLRLLGIDKVFVPSDREAGRDPMRDIEELSTVLAWRDRELTTAKSIALSLGVKHLLFHRKGRIDTFWKAAVEHKPCFYLSHAISQVRRDWHQSGSNKKCQRPDPKRGDALLAQIQGVADALGDTVALFEPTCIDEARLDLDRLDAMRMSDLKAAVLPPLTKRWPIGHGDRLGDSPSDIADKGGLVAVGQEHFAQHFPIVHQLGKPSASERRARREEEKIERAAFVAVKTAAAIMQREIIRQITVRDFTLAEQSDVIIAVRPYSNQDTAQISGGVQRELDSMMIRDRIEPLAKPTILAIHTTEDEQHRRRNEFNLLFESLWNQYGALPNKPSEAFKSALRDVFLGWTKAGTGEELVASLENAVAQHSAPFRRYAGGSTMDSEALVGTHEARGRFLEDLARSEILSPRLIVQSKKENPIVVMVEHDPNSAEFVGTVQDAESRVEKIKK